jgi:heme exporter protein A
MQNFPVEKYSTGMKRRLALARLMLSGATCWLLDEPVYGLDTAALATFSHQLEQHLKAGGMTLVISHDTAPLRGLISRTIHLATGA